MATLSQLIGISKGVKSKTNSFVTEIYHRFQKKTLAEGQVRTYEPTEENGEKLPSEANKVQVHVSEELKKAFDALARMFDVVATVDAANTLANADIVIDGRLVVPNVLPTTLIFLEKQITELRTLVEEIPLLDPNEDWSLDEATGLQKSGKVVTASKKPQKRVLIKYEATDKHPAQTEMYEELSIVGYWTKVRTSGAMQKPMVDAMLERIDKLHQAVVFAREKANNVEVVDEKIGNNILGYVLGN